MANPTPSDLHVNVPLSNLSIAYFADQTEYIADKVFKNVPVMKQSDLYWKYNKGDWFRTDAQKRAPGAESVGSGWNVTTDSYYADVYALHKDIDDQTRANADSIFSLDADATKFVTDQLMRKRDKLWLSNYFTTGIWDTDLTGVSGSPSSGQVKQWDAAGSTPMEDIYAQVVNMKEKTGFKPNTLVIGARVWPVLKNHAEIIDRIKYTRPGGAFLDEALVASALGIDNVLIAWATENTATEAVNPSPASLSFMVGKHAFLCYSNPSPGLQQPSAGYTFSWNGYMGASAFGTRMKRFRMEANASERIEGEMAFSLKTVATDLGTFISGVVS
jgi:hypothetical protein